MQQLFDKKNFEAKKKEGLSALSPLCVAHR
jgi:hypothetical protein